MVLSNKPGLDALYGLRNHIRPTIKLELLEWSLQNTVNSSRFCHGCLIPSDLNDTSKSKVSSNRLITSFALGLPVSADLVDSYSPYADYFHNIRKSPLSDFYANLSNYYIKVELAQKKIVPLFSYEYLIKKWKNLFLLPH
jgi:hypothetical protein